MSYVITDVELSKNPATVNEEIKVIITVEAITWDYLNKHYTWDSLKDSGLTWASLVNGK